MHPMLTIAVKAARRAGNIINKASLNLDLLNVSKKSHSDYVSEVDGAAEDAIIKILLTAYPDHAILAEESGRQGDHKKSEYQWIIDPLDGTTNFLHGFPKYSVSIALKHKGVLTFAVVYDPTNNELFTASRGGGAYLNDHRIRVSKRTRLEDCLIGTGFPFRDLTHMDRREHRLEDRYHRRDSTARRPQQEIAIEAARSESAGRRQHLDRVPGEYVVAQPV